jgi:hypothetical protein
MSTLIKPEVPSSPLEQCGVFNDIQIMRRKLDRYIFITPILTALTEKKLISKGRTWGRIRKMKAVQSVCDKLEAQQISPWFDLKAVLVSLKGIYVRYEVLVVVARELSPLLDAYLTTIDTAALQSGAVVVGSYATTTTTADDHDEDNEDFDEVSLQLTDASDCTLAMIAFCVM